MAAIKYENINAYHQIFPPEIIERMQCIRQLIHKHAPKAEEHISYAMPCFKYKGYLIYYAGYKNHIALYYPWSAAFKTKFAKQLANYKTSRATIQFPNNLPLPIAFIEQAIKFRVKENEQKI